MSTDDRLIEALAKLIRATEDKPLTELLDLDAIKRDAKPHLAEAVAAAMFFRGE